MNTDVVFGKEWRTVNTINTVFLRLLNIHIRRTTKTSYYIKKHDMKSIFVFFVWCNTPYYSLSYSEANGKQWRTHGATWWTMTHTRHHFVTHTWRHLVTHTWRILVNSDEHAAPPGEQLKQVRGRMYFTSKTDHHLEVMFKYGNYSFIRT